MKAQGILTRDHWWEEIKVMRPQHNLDASGVSSFQVTRKKCTLGSLEPLTP